MALILTTSFFLVGPAPATATGIAAIFTRIQQLEEQMAGLELARQHDFSVLDENLTELKSKADSGGTTGSSDDIAARLAQLESDMDRLSSTVDAHASAQLSDSLSTVLESLLEHIEATLLSPRPHEDPRPTSEPQAAPSLAGVSVSGFVDGSYFQEDGSVEPSTFGLDQIELRLSRELQRFGSIHVDLDWVSDGAGGFTMDVEQGFVTFTPSDVVDFWFGKFNAPIGFELLDAPDMYQFSHALVFNYGLPTNLTGAMLSLQVHPRVDVVLHASNGWDENVDLATGKTLGARVGFTLHEHAVVGVSGMTDAGVEDGAEELSVMDVDATLTPSPEWTLGAEFNVGAASLGNVNRSWSGVLLMGHHDCTDRYGLTLRYDCFDDEDGSRIGSGLAEVRQAVTLAPTIDLGNGMGARFELRTDWSDQAVFENASELDKSLFRVAFEITYSF